MGKKSSKKARPRQSRTTSMTDPGTRELGLRHTLKVERYSAGVRVRNLTGSPLESLLYAGLLTDQTFGTIDDFLADMYRCGHIGIKSSDYQRSRVDGGGQSEEMPIVYTKTQERLRKIGSLLGPEYITLLYALLNHDYSVMDSKRSKEICAAQLQAICTVLDTSL